MDYRELHPPDALALWIDCIWTLRGTGGGADAVLPDGRTEIVLNFGDRFRRHAGGTTERQPRALFVGPMRKAVVLEPEGAIDLVGIRLRPAAAGSIVPASLHELGDRIPGLADVAPRLAPLLERVGNSDDRAGEVLAMLRPVLLAADPPEPRLARAVDLIQALHGDIAIDRAARETGWSARQLQRRFHQNVGLGPKTFARVLRVQAAARAAPRAAHAGWAGIAAACGFFDQAHLIREFREIAGRSPAAYFGAPHALGQVFTAT